LRALAASEWKLTIVNGNGNEGKREISIAIRGSIQILVATREFTPSWYV
jgi:hypothetical protein